MNKADHFREAETALGTQSREQAKAELKNVGAERLVASLTEFIEWRAFPYWLRVCVESAGSSGCAFSSGRGQRLFADPIAENWRHALGYYATRDPRMDQLRAHWKRCRQAWKRQPPATLPRFESWRATAFQPH